jgi:hypothetical protein
MAWLGSNKYSWASVNVEKNLNQAVREKLLSHVAQLAEQPDVFWKDAGSIPCRSCCNCTFSLIIENQKIG